MFGEHSPHKFRHGHAVYALKMARDVSGLKAVSQNLMHENLAITDGIYGVLSSGDVETRTRELVGKNEDDGESELGELLKVNMRLLKELRKLKQR